jgi:hypothetical protein
MSLVSCKGCGAQEGAQPWPFARDFCSASCEIAYKRGQVDEYVALREAVQWVPNVLPACCRQTLSRALDAMRESGEGRH